MSGIFGIINLGISALLAHRNALNVRAHNLANVATPGYSRQEAMLATNPPLPPAGTAEATLGGQFGTGVHAHTIRRARETFLSVQARICQGALGRWSAAGGALRQVEPVLSPSPGEDLSALLDRFWDAWGSVAARPEDAGLRHVLRGVAETVCATFRDYVQRLQSIRLTVDTGIRAKVDEVNALARQIADYNRQIGVALAEQRAPNDLYDSRDLLLDRLAQLTGALPVNTESAHLILYLDGRPLLQGAAAYPLTLANTPGGAEIHSSFDDAPVQIAAGEIAGLLAARDTAIPAYLAQLDSIASSLVAEVNARHQPGFGLDAISGRDFFLPGSTAADLALDPAILADVRAIAASASDAPGDGSVAQQIADLRITPLLAGHTLNEAAQALLAMVGHDVSACDSGVAAQEFAFDQIRQQEQSVSGVSIDEELSYLALCQHAYNAAARIISTADEMLATVIDRMGVR